MEFSVASQALLNPLLVFNHIISPKPAQPSFGSILFNITNNKLTITAGDGDTVIEADVELISSDGNLSITIPAKTITDSLRFLPEQPIVFNVDPESYQIRMQYSNGELKMIGGNADEYPDPIVLGNNALSLSLSGETLLNGLTRTSFATADDDMRPVMNGVYFDIEENNITFVASDGHKLSKNSFSPVNTESKASFILPKKPITLLKNIINKDTTDVNISFDDKCVFFNIQDYRIISRLIQGRFPNYNLVIPKNNPFELTIDRTALVDVLKRVSLYSSTNTSLVVFEILENKLIVSAQDKDFSKSAQESMPCQYNGSPLKIGFQHVFLTDILNNLPGQEIIMHLADPSRACVLESTEQTPGSELVMLLMPMVINI
ncbi:MAG: DNA polymerase III subunit beta [Bacteroidaceae bacterium]|nr:DNA polymerase III subunit beta [Bacteroidaceae bacterium]